MGILNNKTCDDQATCQGVRTSFLTYLSSAYSLSVRRHRQPIITHATFLNVGSLADHTTYYTHTITTNDSLSVWVLPRPCPSASCHRFRPL